MRETAGGADITGTASSITASSTFSGGTAAANAIDNNLSTIWASAIAGPPHTLTLVYPISVSVVEVAIRARSDAAADQTPSSFILESSTDSGATWNFEMQRSATGWTLGEQRVFTSQSNGLGNAPGAYRYWRAYLYDPETAGNYFGFTEMILRDAGGVNRSGSGGFANVLASDNLNGGNTATNGFDGNIINSGWLTNLGASSPQSIDGDFQGVGGYGSPVEVKTFDIYGSWNVPDASPKRLALAWSNDRLNWDVAQQYSGQTGWTAAQLRTFTVY